MFNGKRVEFRSLSEIKELIEIVEAEVNNAAGTTPIRRYHVGAAKGF